MHDTTNGSGSGKGGDGGLTLLQQLSYATPNISMAIAGGVIMSWLQYYWCMGEVGDGVPFIALTTFGLINLFGRLVDAFADPIIGYASDKTKSRWGRRMPWIVGGAPVLAVTFAALFFVPFAPGSVGNSLYLAAVLGLFWIAFTAVFAPYLALLPEIVPDPKKRTGTTSFMAVGQLIGTILTGVVVGMMVETRPVKGDGFLRSITTAWKIAAEKAEWATSWFDNGFELMALVMGVVVLVTAVVPIINIREKKRHEIEGDSMGFLQGVLTTFKNRPFLMYLVSLVGFRIAADMVMIALPTFVRVILRETEATAGLIMGGLVILAVFLIPVINWLSKRIGKKKLWIIIGAEFVLVMILWSFAGRVPFISPFAYALIVFGLAVVPIAASLVIPYAMLSDIIDLDFDTTGKRREGTYFGMEGLIFKAATGVAQFVTPLLFAFFGAGIGDDLGILLVGPVGGVLVLVGIAIFTKYPISE